MGFLSGLGKSLFGGSDSESSQQSTSGFSLLPQEIQGAYKNYGTAVNNQIPNATSAFTPIPQTAGETQAYDAINKGFTPTADSLNSDLSMLNNPFNSSVIDQLNRQANGEFSILKQNATQAGQFGSNRQQLGANDIENSRQSNIGSLMQNQYNQALNTIFGSLIPQRQQDAANQLNAGANQRQLALQTSAAPITGIQQVGTALGILPSNGGSQSTGTSNASSQNGMFKQIGF